MRWVLRLIATEGDARCLSTDLIEICRPEGLGDIADLGLTLPEAKQLLASVQRAVIAAQADSHRLQRPCCSACSGKCHLKDWRSHRIATPFGAVTVPLPRFRCIACDRIETGVCWPSRCRSTPELDQLQAHLSALMTYRVAADVLQHLLPIDAGMSPETCATIRCGSASSLELQSRTNRLLRQRQRSLSAWIRHSSGVAKRVNGTWKSASVMSKLQAADGRCSAQSRRLTPISRR